MVAGQRAAFQPSGYGFQAAHCFCDVYYRLDRPVTGTIISEGSAGTVFRPDDWPVPAGVWPHGFLTDALGPLAVSAETVSGELVHADGSPVSGTEMVQTRYEYLRCANGSIFDDVCREDALILATT